MIGLNTVNRFLTIIMEIQSWLNIYMYVKNFEHFRVCFLQVLIPKEENAYIKYS